MINPTINSLNKHNFIMEYRDEEGNNHYLYFTHTGKIRGRGKDVKECLYTQSPDHHITWEDLSVWQNQDKRQAIVDFISEKKILESRAAELRAEKTRARQMKDHMTARLRFRLKGFLQKNDLPDISEQMTEDQLYRLLDVMRSGRPEKPPKQ